MNATRMRSRGYFYKRNSRQALFHGDQAQPIRCDLTEPRPEPPFLGGGRLRRPTARIAAWSASASLNVAKMLHRIERLCLGGGMTTIRFRQIDERFAKSG